MLFRSDFITRMITTSPISLSLLYRAENKRFLTLKRTKTGGIQPMLNVACFVQSCLTDADFVIFSNYCLIGTRLRRSFSFITKGKRQQRRANRIAAASRMFQHLLFQRHGVKKPGGDSIAFRFQSTLVLLGDGPGDGQPQAEAGLFPPGGIRPVKPFK